MTTAFPFRFEPIDDRYLITTDAGDFFFGDKGMLQRMVGGERTPEDDRFLIERGFAFRDPGDFHFASFLRRLAWRKAVPKRIGYLLIVPTLRCDLTCSYCQVSRAHPEAAGFDWSDETLDRFLAFIDNLDVDTIKIEFQGGEPTLRTDLIGRVVDHCDKRFSKAEFVICSNLSHVSPELFALLERDNVSVSTSLDGPADLHRRNRTGSHRATQQLLQTIDDLRTRFGQSKVSALPTITAEDYERITKIVDTYVERGFDRIFLRPVSYHGFARKRHADVRAGSDAWTNAYGAALDHIFDLNWSGEGPIWETGLEILLRRIFSPSYNGHVDLRSPNPVARDYLVIDYDGRFYPSDEARMLARIGHVDLCIGDLERGLDREKIATLNWNQFSEIDPDCIHCAFQPYCGIDTVDSLAREGRIDAPRHLTWFCQTNMAAFRRIFGMLRRGEPRDLANLSGHLTGHLDLTPFYGQLFYDPADAASARV